MEKSTRCVRQTQKSFSTLANPKPSLPAERLRGVYSLAIKGKPSWGYGCRFREWTEGIRYPSVGMGGNPSGWRLSPTEVASHYFPDVEDIAFTAINER